VYSRVWVVFRVSTDRCPLILINTGWTRGQFSTGTGKHFPPKYTLCIVDVVHSGELAKAKFEKFGMFRLSILVALEGVPQDLLNLRLA
jgi:phosphoenolpyruvate carboxykinase (ATP)